MAHLSGHHDRMKRSKAVLEALEFIRKYPHQWVSYSSDVLTNSVITYLKAEGKIITNQFRQFKAAPKHKKNPAPPFRERSDRLMRMRKNLTTKMRKADRVGNMYESEYWARKIRKLDRIIYTPRNAKRRK